ncbi:BrnT family toxin (plasmid) [Aquicoccus sp. G2-2]|uniref:BrnT family toxin n=1 Tax=Aquicoccus sp. G2-2 TaxID=3092120 RepID=UPI00367135AB
MRTRTSPTSASFEVAARVFLDPLHLSVQDRIENGEQRWQTLGQVGSVTIILAAHTFTEEGPTDEPVEVIRIISARLATRRERMRYEEG